MFRICFIEPVPLLEERTIPLYWRSSKDSKIGSPPKTRSTIQ